MLQLQQNPLRSKCRNSSGLWPDLSSCLFDLICPLRPSCLHHRADSWRFLQCILGKHVLCSGSAGLNTWDWPELEVGPDLSVLQLQQLVVTRHHAGVFHVSLRVRAARVKQREGNKTERTSCGSEDSPCWSQRWWEASPRLLPCRAFKQQNQRDKFTVQRWSQTKPPAHYGAKKQHSIN